MSDSAKHLKYKPWWLHQSMYEAATSMANHLHKLPDLLFDTVSICKRTRLLFMQYNASQTSMQGQQV